MAESIKVAAVRDPFGFDKIEIQDRAKPELGDGEILVKVKASSLNFHDLAVALGFIPTEDNRVLMSDGAGIVEGVGAGVTEFKTGDKVVSTFMPTWPSGPIETAGFGSVPGDGVDGWAAEYVVTTENGITHMPEGWTYDEAATLPCAAVTAWRALMVEAQIKPGDWVLTLGSGGVSVFALQFAKMAGARVIATSSSDEKLDRLKKLGADEVINYKDTPEWGKKAKELTGGRGVDATVEIGGPGTLGQSIAASRVGGSIVLIGVLTGGAGEVPTSALMMANIKLSGITVGSRAMQIDMVNAINTNGMKPVISDTFALKDIAKAFEHQQAGKHFGKIVLEI